MHEPAYIHAIQHALPMLSVEHHLLALHAYLVALVVGEVAAVDHPEVHLDIELDGLG